MTTRRTPGTGTVRQLASGRWQARFRGPDGVLRAAPRTFDTKVDAAAWLRSQTADVDRGTWSVPTAPAPRGALTVRDYAASWLDSRQLRPSTRKNYRSLVDHLIVPALGDELIDRLSPATIRTWFGQLPSATPKRTAAGYSLLRTILGTAYADDLITANPCRIRGAGASKTKRRPEIATLAELDVIVAIVPARYKAMMLLTAWCGLRFGELAELRRGDVDLDNRRVRISRAFERTNGIGNPKTEAGIRAVGVPPHVWSAVVKHLKDHVGAEPDALLFPAKHGGNLSLSTLQKVWYPAREAAGRPDLHFHDLRHFAATRAGQANATTAELMHRYGHATPDAVMIYQHGETNRDDAIAAEMSRQEAAERKANAKAKAKAAAKATGNVVPMRRRG